MRAKEFIKENASIGATSAASMASYSQSLGSMVSRSKPLKAAKYANSLLKRKPHARG
jgi:hypothetical protein